MLDILAQVTSTSEPDVMQALRDSQAFYKDSWDSLLKCGTILLTIFLAIVGAVGLLFPLLLERARQKRFELAEDRLKGMESQMEGIEKRALERIEAAEKIFGDEQKAMLEKMSGAEKRIDRFEREIPALLDHVQGLSLASLRQYWDAAECYASAVVAYLSLGNGGMVNNKNTEAAVSGAALALEYATEEGAGYDPVVRGWVDALEAKLKEADGCGVTEELRGRFLAALSAARKTRTPGQDGKRGKTVTGDGGQ